MKTKSIYMTSLLFFCLGSVGQTHGQSLQGYLTVAAENNPALKARFSEYRASLEKVPQAGSLPDPQLSLGYFTMPMERYMGDQVAEIALMQMFPWFGTLGAAKNEAALMAKARFESFNEAKLMLYYEVKARYYALYLLNKQLVITEENLQVLQNLEEIAISRFKSGTSGSGSTKRTNPSSEGQMRSNQPPSSGGMNGMNGMQQQGSSSDKSSMNEDMGAANTMSDMSSSGNLVDVLRVQMESNELRNRLALLRDGIEPIRAQFNTLLNRPLDESISLSDSIIQQPLPVPITEVPDSIRRNNPMLKMLELEEKAFRAQAKMNRKMGFPMIGLGLQYGIFKPRPGNESMMNGNDMLMPMATISIPLWRRKYNASVREASLMGESAAERRQDAGNQLMVSYEEALKDYKDAQRRIELYQQQIALAQQAQNILTVQYSTAGANFEEVMRLQQQLLDYRLRAIEAIVDQNVSAAMLERLMGKW